MQKVVLIIVLFLCFHSSYSQNKYWQQEVNFTINVSLNDKEHTLDAFETIEYINRSPDTLKFIWFHLWPNAYKNDKTAFSEQTLSSGSTKFYFSNPEDRGYINRLNFKADNVTAKLQTSEDIDVVRIVLPAPLAPGNKTTITTPFHVKLPYNFSRGGHIKQDYQVSQWFPKPAVYDSKGWHPMPYLDQGEFYSEFGSYDVEITLPGDYVVAATGKLQDAETLKQLKEKGTHEVTTGNKTWRFTQNNIHDFAWFASKDFTAHYDTVVLPSKKVIDVFSYYKSSNEAWQKSLAYAKEGLRKYSEWIGDYPYDIATVVQGNNANENAGGIEYPTITLITTQETGHELDATIVHEIGHNWFYAALANNERDHAWMDEGINTYYQKRYEQEKYNDNLIVQSLPKSLQKKMPDDFEKLLIRTIQKMHKDQPIETPSADFSTINYGLIEYSKAGEWMKELEDALGRTAFDNSMHQYYNEWKFKHPSPQDFQQSIEKAGNKSLQPVFDQLNTTGLPAASAKEKRSLKASFLFNLKDTKKYNYISILPAAGYNNYDKLMLGGIIHNYQLPLNKFQFIAGGLYATGTSKFNTLARASYTVYNKRYNLEPAISFFNFSTNDFTTADNNTVSTSVRRITPSLKLTLFNKNATSTRRFIAQWKTFFIKEEELNFETVIRGMDTFERVNTKPYNSTINRLSFTLQDARVLYPYSINISADQGKSFVRTGLTAKYYFNYKDGKSGMQARLFAGKFFYLKEKTFIERSNNDRYFLNMSGPSGLEDYSYSNYFLGRREFQGFMSQQIMERDGFFKVRSDLLNEEIGKTDNWLISLNLVTDVPNNLNPLRVLPFKIPLKLFADAGTYADVNRQTGAGRFLYDAGIQVPVLGSFINVYIPLIYSKVYSDYFKSTIPKNRFLKNIAFTIDLEKLKPAKLLSAIPL